MYVPCTSCKASLDSCSQLSVLQSAVVARGGKEGKGREGGEGEGGREREGGEERGREGGEEGGRRGIGEEGGEGVGGYASYTVIDM